MKKLITTIVAALFLLSANAMAEGMKVGADYLMLSSEVGSAVDFDTSAVQIRLSNGLGQNFDVEGVLAFGLSDDTVTAYDPIDLGNVSLTMKLSKMLGVFAKFHSDPSSGLQVFGRFGMAMVDFDIDVDIENLGSASASYDDTGLAFGVGVAFNISETSAIVAEYSKWPDVDVEGTDIETDVISIGFQVSL